MNQIVKKIFKAFGLVVFIYAFICFITPFNKFLRNRSIENQIHYLSEILDNGYDDKLQLRFPEGKLFSNAILALAVIEYCNHESIANIEYSKIVDNCILRIGSEENRSIFDAEMTPKYGMFYNGWSNFVYSEYKKSILFNKTSIRNYVLEQAAVIENRLVSSQLDSVLILDSYIGASWPADNLIGIVSLDDKQIQERWVDKLLEESTHISGLICHMGEDRNTIRGSSSALITYALQKIEFENLGEYNDKYTDLFIDNYCGIQLVKENEDGTNTMDVDSGPVVFGYGASGTVMNIKAQCNFSNMYAKTTWGALNFISLPINGFKNKYYLTKKEPMLDLFMLWASVSL